MGSSPGFRHTPTLVELPPERYDVELLHLTKDDKPLRWHVSRIKKIDETDLTLLESKHYNGELGGELLKSGITTSLDFHLPRAGDVISVTGFLPQNDPIETNKMNALELHRYTHTLEDVDFYGMPNIKAPAIQTRAPIIGGMSGGPVFNDKGKLIGICSASIEPKDAADVDFYTSWISLIHPLLFSLIKVRLPSVGLVATTIYELAKKGYVNAHGLSHIVPEKNGFRYLPLALACDECPNQLRGAIDYDIKVRFLPPKLGHH